MIINTQLFLAIALIVMLLFITIIIFLFLKSKNIYEKIQLITPFNSLTTLFIGLYCYYINKPQYIDMALAYAVLSFIGILGIKKYFELSVKKNK